MKQTIFSILIISFTTLVNAQNPQRINAKLFLSLIQKHPDALVLDTRPLDKYKLYRIKNAVPLPTKAELIDVVKELDRQDTIFVYCEKELRSASAIESLDSLGFKCVYELKGGLINWRRNSLPLDESEY